MQQKGSGPSQVKNRSSETTTARLAQVLPTGIQADAATRPLLSSNSRPCSSSESNLGSSDARQDAPPAAIIGFAGEAPEHMIWSPTRVRLSLSPVIAINGALFPSSLFQSAFEYDSPDSAESISSFNCEASCAFNVIGVMLHASIAE